RANELDLKRNACSTRSVRVLEDAHDTGIVLLAQPERGSHLVYPVRSVGKRRPEALISRGQPHEPHIFDEDVEGALRGDELAPEHPFTPVLEHERVGRAVPDRLEHRPGIEAQRPPAADGRVEQPYPAPCQSPFDPTDRPGPDRTHDYDGGLRR